MAPRNRLRRLPCLVLAAGWVLQPWPAANVAAAPAAARCPRATLVYQGKPQGNFEAVAATSPTDVWVLGQDGSTPPLHTLLLHWDGQRWGRTVFAYTLSGISAPSAHDVWLVGSLVLHGDGHRWRAVPASGPSRPGALGIVALSPADVWIVGAYDPLIEHWDGARWRGFPPAGTHHGDRLAAIAAGSADDIWAVGDSDDGTSLVVHWDGRAWRRVPSPPVVTLPDGSQLTSHLTAVAVGSPTEAWAVGYGEGLRIAARPFAIHWDGVRWRAVPDALNGETVQITSVAIVAGREAWATPGVALERWDGRRWGITFLRRDVGLWAVAAPASEDVWVGGAGPGNIPIVEHITFGPCPGH